MKLVLSPRARADIDDIWDYTLERWGERQAEVYLRIIEEAANAVTKDPTIGRACDDVRPGYRRYPAGSHTLFYRVTAADVVVVRILHGRMDVEHHL